jgi:predicted dehydrogenase
VVRLGEPAEVKICESADEHLSQVDVVDVCTSLRYHPYYCTMALEPDVHVMTAKPMARIWRETSHVARLSSRRSALLQLNDDNLFIPRYLRMRNVIESGMISEVQNLWIAVATLARRERSASGMGWGVEVRPSSTTAHVPRPPVDSSSDSTRY